MPEKKTPDATPAAEELAEERGIDIDDVEGTGLDGRVTKGDVEDAPVETPDPTPAAEELAEELGVDIDDVEGTGLDGRVTKADVEDAPVVEAPEAEKFFDETATPTLVVSESATDLSNANERIRDLAAELSRCEQRCRDLTNDLEVAQAARDAAQADAGSRSSAENELRLEVSVLQGKVNAAANALS